MMEENASEDLFWGDNSLTSEFTNWSPSASGSGDEADRDETGAAVRRPYAPRSERERHADEAGTLDLHAQIHHSELEPPSLSDAIEPPSVRSHSFTIELDAGDNPIEEEEESTRKPLVAPPPVQESTQMRVEDNPNFFEISITSTEVQGDGVSAFVTYTVVTKTSLELYKSSEMVAKRRFSDFVWLQEQLVLHHKGIIIPPLPDKAYMQTNKISGNRFNEAFIDYRRRELQKFLRRVACHPSLCTSKFLQLFLETEDSSALVAHKDVESAPAQNTGFFSLFGKGVKSLVVNVGTEIDPWFQERGEYIATLHAKLEAASNMAMLVTQHYNDGIAKQEQFRESMVQLGDAEKASSSATARGFLRLAEIHAQTQLMEFEMRETLNREFIDSLKDYSRMVQSVQRVLECRLEKLGAFQAAVKDLEMKNQKLSQKREDTKLLALVETAQAKVDETKEIYESISELVKGEILRFEETKEQELVFALSQYAQANMNYTMCTLDMWRKFTHELQ